MTIKTRAFLRGYLGEKTAATTTTGPITTTTPTSKPPLRRAWDWFGQAAKSVPKGVFNILQPTDHDLWEKKQMEQRFGDPVKRGNTIMPKYRKTIREGQAEAARLRNEGK
jgi:hypothetical protein